MDYNTIIGLGAFVVLITFGVVTGQISKSLVNLHGVFVVMGGCLVAILINTPFAYTIKAVTQLRFLMFSDETDDIKSTVGVMTALAGQCRSRGIAALKEANTEHAGGFLARVSTAALEYNDSNFVRRVITQEINQAADDMNEIANVYRTVGLLSPMFGLLGTLMGIISVLKNLSDPESVGPAMGVAITSAFYGIFFANMVCVPISGKIRSRIWLQVKLRTMILEGIIEIMQGSVPIVVERRMQSYL